MITLLWLFAAIVALGALVLNVTTLRRILISNRALRAFRRKLPPVSQTEREAIEAELAEEGEKPDPNGLYFVDDIVGGAVPGEYIPAVEKGFRAAAQRGGRFPFQCIDIRCRLWTDMPP